MDGGAFNTVWGWSRKNCFWRISVPDLCHRFLAKTFWGTCSNRQPDWLAVLSFSYRRVCRIGTSTGILKSRIQYRILYGNVEKRRRFLAIKNHPYPKNDTPPRNFPKIGPDTPSEKKGNSMYAYCQRPLSMVYEICPGKLKSVDIRTLR